MKRFLSFLARPPILLLLILYVSLFLCHLFWEFLFPGTERQPKLLWAVALIGLLAVLVSLIPQYILAARRRRAMMGPVAGELEQALEAMGDGSLGSTERLLRMPWVLVLGTPQCGKATALAHHDFAQKTADPRTRNPLCFLWKVRGRDAVMVQPRGRVWEDDGLWRELLFWLQRRRPVDAVLLQVSAPELLTPAAEAGALRSRLTERLRELGHLRAGLPLVAMVTKCDRVDGFVRFFSDLTEQQRNEPWGFTTDLRDYELCSARVAAKIGEDAVTEDSLLAPLWLAAHDAFRCAINAEDRTAVMGFPAEMTLLSRQLGMFLDTVCSARQEQGRPRLLDVLFTSARQGEIPVTGARHELRRHGQVMRVRPALSGSGNIGAFFLRGALERVLDRATESSRPPLRLHSLALVLSLCFCAGGSFILGRSMVEPTTWLEKTQQQIQALSRPPSLTTNSNGDTLIGELDQEFFLGTLLGPRFPDRRQGLTRGAYHDASMFLRCRAGSQLVAPVLQYDSSPAALNKFYADLAQNSGGGKGQSLFRVYLALKAVAVLKKRFLREAGQITCPATLSEQDRDEIASYLAELWGRRDEGVLKAKLARGMRLFLDLYLQDQDKEPWPTIELQQQELNNAQEKLLSVFKGGIDPSRDTGADAAGVAEMYFFMRAQKDNLLTPKPLLIEEPIIKEPGIGAVYTQAGCQRLFRRDDQWGAWLACVRGERVEGRAPDEALKSFYTTKQTQAWKSWLSQLILKEDLPEDAQTAAERLGSFSRDLKEIFSVVGQGRGSKSKKASGSPELSAKSGPDAAKPAGEFDVTSEPSVCLKARNAFAIFSYAIGEDSPDDEAQAASIRDAWTGYQEALAGMQTALHELAVWRAAPEAALQPYRAANVALLTLTERRKKLVTALRDAGPDLRRLLEGIEQDLRKVLRGSLRKFLTDNWRALYEQWKPIRPVSGRAQGTQEIERVRRFIDEQVANFAAKFIDPLDETTRGEIICSESLAAIKKARRPPAESQPPPPPQNPPARPTAISPPTITVPACEKPPQLVVFHAGAFGRFQCEPSTHRCGAPAAPPTPTPEATKVLVQAEYEDGLFPKVVPLTREDTLSGLVKVHGSSEQAQRIPLDFQAPKRGKDSCRIIIYISSAMVEPSSSAGNSQPTLTVSLPERLTCQ